LLFKIAFHPKIYKNRGLSEQALIHASEDTGQRFFRRFNEFCTAGKATENYFLQYFLTGKCITDDSFPDYLKPCNKDRLMANQDSIEFRHIGFAEFMKSEDKLQYNKIHFSNLGDWMNLADFNRCMESVKSKCMPGTRICYRYLQKDHCELGNPKGFDIVRSGLNTNPDRFPFYTTYLITLL
jgi:S-adenosylmethionine:diacylglycerol 3-amino-3-carboxypropyl transferase